MIYIPGERCFKGNKLNTNENIFSTSKNCVFLLKILKNNIEKIKFYPHSDNLYLTKIISNFYKINKNKIFICNGSDEGLFLIFFLFKNFKIKIPKISYPFYNVYSNFFKIYRKKVKFKNILKFKNIIFPNPNSPSGEYYKKNILIKKIYKKNFLILDEAYSEFYNLGLKNIINNNNNLIIINTLSKAFSMAGARLGVIFSNKFIINKLKFIKKNFNSYNINTITNYISIESIKDRNYLIYNIQKNNYYKLLFNFLFKKKSFGNFICLKKKIDFFFFFKKNNFFFRYLKYNIIRISISNFKNLKKIFIIFNKWS
ncbi:aminotransferase class I/II-fold pyridoxal phosphate-dependent enzyme [Candidatus Carsonella ruddii]|uniref:aminotransferase class I/II-fold pyridoxal phosphate-dependent enzyme n=1 Tax=Carsonella ruddii TaxID=114186 RepID=UPI003D3CBF92